MVKFYIKNDKIVKTNVKIKKLKRYDIIQENSTVEFINYVKNILYNTYNKKCNRVIDKTLYEHNLNSEVKNIMKLADQFDMMREWISVRNEDKKFIDDCVNYYSNIMSRYNTENNIVKHEWILLHMEWKNLMCYGGDTMNIIDFRKLKNGSLTSIIGNNKFGKSSIIDIIVFMLYNKNTKAQNKFIFNNEAKSFYCKLTLAAGNDIYEIIRKGTTYEKGNIMFLFKNNVNIMKSSIPETYSYMEKYIIGPYTNFSRINLIHQEASKFINLSNNEQIQYIYNLIGIDKIKLVEKEIRSTRTKKRGELTGYRKSLQEDVCNLQETMEKYDGLDMKNKKISSEINAYKKELKVLIDSKEYKYTGISPDVLQKELSELKYYADIKFTDIEYKNIINQIDEDEKIIFRLETENNILRDKLKVSQNKQFDKSKFLQLEKKYKNKPDKRIKLETLKVQLGDLKEVNFEETESELNTIKNDINVVQNLDYLKQEENHIITKIKHLLKNSNFANSNNVNDIIYNNENTRVEVLESKIHDNENTRVKILESKIHDNENTRVKILELEIHKIEKLEETEGEIRHELKLIRNLSTKQIEQELKNLKIEDHNFKNFTLDILNDKLTRVSIQLEELENDDIKKIPSVIITDEERKKFEDMKNKHHLDFQYSIKCRYCQVNKKRTVSPEEQKEFSILSKKIEQYDNYQKFKKLLELRNECEKIETQISDFKEWEELCERKNNLEDKLKAAKKADILKDKLEHILLYEDYVKFNELKELLIKNIKNQEKSILLNDINNKLNILVSNRIYHKNKKEIERYQLYVDEYEEYQLLLVLQSKEKYGEQLDRNLVMIDNLKKKLEQNKVIKNKFGENQSYNNIKKRLTLAVDNQICMDRVNLLRSKIKKLKNDIINLDNLLVLIKQQELIENTQRNILKRISECEYELELISMILKSLDVKKDGFPIVLFENICKNIINLCNSQLQLITDFKIDIPNEKKISWSMFIIPISSNSKVPVQMGSGFQKCIIDVMLRIAFMEIYSNYQIYTKTLIADESFSACDEIHIEKLARDTLPRLANLMNIFLVISHKKMITAFTDNSIILEEVGKCIYGDQMYSKNIDNGGDIIIDEPEENFIIEDFKVGDNGKTYFKCEICGKVLIQTNTAIQKHIMTKFHKARAIKKSRI